MQCATIIVALTRKEALKYITISSEMGKCSLLRCLVRYATKNRLRKQRWNEKERNKGERNVQTNKQTKKSKY